jgi:enoyl-CoA hydratase/carnithine racemase
MSQDSLVTTLHPTKSGDAICWLELNRPEKLNVLNLDLVTRLENALVEALENPKIVAVFLSGRGSKGFCAGGDVVEVVQTVAAQPDSLTPAAPFFSTEYRLDQRIHQAQKPIIVLGQGIVMGGGIGLYAGATHRILTPNSLLAMPEISIGLFPDVGGSYFLNQMPGKMGRFLGLTAARFSAADAFYIHFADHYSLHTEPEPFIEQLKQTVFSADPQEHSQQVSEALSPLLTTPPPESESQLARFRSEIDRLTEAPDIETFSHRLLHSNLTDPWFESCQTQFTQGSPFSIHLIEEQLRRGMTLSLEEALAMELIMAVNMTRHPEFTIGVTARLIDRNPNPEWRWESLAEVPREEVLNIFKDPF